MIMDTMANFFKHAPPRDTYQKRFLEAIGKQQSLIASFPLGYPVVSLYAFTALMGTGLAVVVCPSSRHIRRNLEYFRTAGIRFPDVAFLDGTQMPHEERAVYQEINHNRVHLLYTTPDRFASLNFLQMLVHASVNFLVIEEADRLLPSTTGHSLYRRFYEDGLNQLRHLPPMMLLVPPLPPRRLRELSEHLKLPEYQVLQCSPQLESVAVQVRRLHTEHQKFTVLVETLSGNPERGKLGRLDTPGSVLIQTAYPAQAEKLGASLIDYGFDSVWITHFKKTTREQAQILDVANTRLNAIIVNAGSDMRAWQPPAESSPRVVFWTPPGSLEDLTTQVFRQMEGLQTAGYDARHMMKALVLHTREDFQAAVKRLQHSRVLELEEIQEKLRALRHFRRWVLSEECRLQSLAAYYQGVSRVEIPPCGHCDRCLRKAAKGEAKPSMMQQLLKHWLY